MTGKHANLKRTDRSSVSLHLARAVSMFKRAMRMHGVNSDEAHYWDKLATDLESALRRPSFE